MYLFFLVYLIMIKIWVIFPFVVDSVMARFVEKLGNRSVKKVAEEKGSSWLVV